MDELLSRAMERREQLRAELEIVERFIHSYSGTREQHQIAGAGKAQLSLFGAPSGPRAKRAAAVKAALDEAEELIVKAGRPLTRGQLVPMLLDLGYDLEGTDKHKVFGTNVWRSNRFLSLKGGGYWPKSKPLPAQYAGLEVRPTIVPDH